MFGIADYGAFCAAIVVFLAIPGPGNFALLTSTAKGGVRGGLAATLGLLVGDQVLLWMAVAGVAAVMASHPHWFLGVQWLGAAYLAGLQAGMCPDPQGFAKTWRLDRRFEPCLDAGTRARKWAGWQNAVSKARTTS